MRGRSSRLKVRKLLLDLHEALAHLLEALLGVKGELARHLGQDDVLRGEKLPGFVIKGVGDPLGFPLQLGVQARG
jgi:hypothetical protein